MMLNSIERVKTNDIWAAVLMRQPGANPSGFLERGTINTGLTVTRETVASNWHLNWQVDPNGNENRGRIICR
jgi:hypothetical protein